MISRNRRAGETAAVGLLVDGGQVGMIATDMEKNLLVSCYKPDMKESAGGKQLVRQCDFNLGKLKLIIVIPFICGFRKNSCQR